MRTCSACWGSYGTWGADEGLAALCPMVVVEHCALGSLAEVWAWAGARLMTAGARVELAEGW